MEQNFKKNTLQATIADVSIKLRHGRETFRLEIWIHSLIKYILPATFLLLTLETQADVTRLREQNQLLEDDITKLRVENEQLRRRRVSTVSQTSSSILEAASILKSKQLTRQATVDGGSMVTFREVN